MNRARAFAEILGLEEEIECSVEDCRKCKMLLKLAIATERDLIY